LEQAFEVAATKERLKEDLKNMEAALAKLGEKDKSVLEYANLFSNPYAAAKK
jgi:hypothetical protein